MKATYIYTPNLYELCTRQASLTISSGTPVRLSKAPAGGKGLSKRFKWIETLDGKFLGMVFADSLVKQVR
jgi:hypothetical protein